MTDTLTTALRFASNGIVAVPVAGDGSKRPGLSSWVEFQKRQPTPDELLQWFSNKPDGVGVICGAISGNLEMLELEGRAVAAKMHLEIAEIAQSSGLGDLWQLLNQGYVEITPSGGLHWLYKVSDGVLPGNTKLARKPGENGGVDVWAETRSEGGFTICAPSSGSTHPSGGEWNLIGGSIETIPTITMSQRTALHTIFEMFDEMPKVEAIAQDVATKRDGTLTPGNDYNARTTWEQILEPLGWIRVYTQGEKTAWRRPGKTIGVSATTNFGGTDKLRVFSTSTAFDAERSYDRFGAYVHLKHGGDFKRAANDLRSQGYGQSDLKSLNESKNLMPKPSQDYLLDGTEADLSEFVTSWEPISLEGYFDGLFTLQEATLLKRTDGAGLLYPGKVHSFYGESESGKSWLAQIACAEVLKSYQKVVYIDFESDPLDIANRLKILGVTKPEAMAYFRYIRPERRNLLDDPAWLTLLEEGSATLIIIDGVTEALTMWEKQTKENDDITQWMREFPRALAKSGAAVVLVDHITKNAETRGRFAIGGQAKLATIDGAAYLIEPLRNLAPGGAGALTVRVTKDRPGSVRRNAGMWRKSDRTQEAAIIEIDSTSNVMKYVICVPAVEEEIEANKEFKKTKEIVEFIHNHPAATRRLVQEGITGSKDVIGDRIADLLTGGWIENKGNERSFILYVTNEGKSHFNLLDAEITQLKAN